MKNNFLKRFFSCIIVFLMFSFVIFAGHDKCSPSNFKFNKTYSTITHSLLPNNIWRNEKEKEIFFNCVQSEEKFVKEIIGEDQSIPIVVNQTLSFGPGEAGVLMPGNQRDLKIFPVEVEVEPGKEYIIFLNYFGGLSFSSILKYYSSDAIQWQDSKIDIYSGSWDFRVQNNKTVFAPRFWDSMKFTVKNKYSDGKPVKKAIVRFMVVAAKMESESLSGFGIFETSNASIQKYLSEPYRDATGIDKNGHFY